MTVILATLALLGAILVGVECVLRFGAPTGSSNRRGAPATFPGSTRVLAIGDSATFGMYLAPEYSYPAQLEDLWNRRHGEYPIEVLNLGYPGITSHRLAANMAIALEATRPDVVLLTAGINDIFSATRYVEAAPDQTGPAEDDSSPTAVLRHLKLYQYLRERRKFKKQPEPGTGGAQTHSGIGQDQVARFAAVAGREQLRWSDDVAERHRLVGAFKAANTDRSNTALAGCETMAYGDRTLVVVSAEESAGDPGSQEKGFQFLQHNLGCIRRTVKNSGAQLYLLNYAASTGLYHPANREIGMYAQNNHGLQFIDVAASVKAAGAAEPLFEDLHPTAEGYRLMAEAVATRLEDALLQRHPGAGPERIGKGVAYPGGDAPGSPAPKSGRQPAESCNND